MAQIDTSFYAPRRGGLDALSAMADSMRSQGQMQRQQKFDEISFQKAEADRIERERQARLRDEQERREGAFRQDFQDMGYQSGLSNPMEIQDLYAEHFPMEVARQQMKRDPNEERRIRLQEERLAQGADRLVLQESAEQRKQKYAPLNFQLKQKSIDSAIKGRKFSQASKLIDQQMVMTRHNQTIEDQEWERNYKLTRSEFEYGKKQEQLLGEIPNIVAKNYIGGSSVGGKNLTPENVKTLTSGTEGASRILNNTDKLMVMIDKHGLEQLPGAEREQMKTLIGSIALQYKSKEFANLGVLTGDDLKILLSVTGDPTSFTALTADIQKQKLGEFREILINGYNKALLTRGFNPIDADELSSMGVTSSGASQEHPDYYNPDVLTPEEESAL